MQKKKRFLFISECKVSSAKPKIQKNERNAKEKTFSFFYSLTQQSVLVITGCQARCDL